MIEKTPSAAIREANHFALGCTLGVESLQKLVGIARESLQLADAAQRVEMETDLERGIWSALKMFCDQVSGLGQCFKSASMTEMLAAAPGTSSVVVAKNGFERRYASHHQAVHGECSRLLGWVFGLAEARKTGVFCCGDVAMPADFAKGVPLYRILEVCLSDAVDLGFFGEAGVEFLAGGGSQKMKI